MQVPAQAQAVVTTPLNPITLHSEPTPTLISQAPLGGAIPTDVTKSGLFRSGELGPLSAFKFRLFQKLPERLFFQQVTELDQRFESNVFQQSRNPSQDYVFRILPNTTVGWNLASNTNIYCNYFVIKDEYAYHKTLSFPTTQSLGLGFHQDVAIGKKTIVGFDVLVRQLWQTSHLRQDDMNPSISVTYNVSPSIVAFASLLLQMRSGQFFQGATRELDPFYSAGFALRRGSWTFVFEDTYVTNFREPPFHYSDPAQGNVSMVADFEVFRPVHPKLPSLVWFVRSEPIWNWASARQPGLSGFDFRFFSGLRMSLNKPSYYASVARIRRQLKELKEQQSKPAPSPPVSPAPPGPAPNPPVLLPQQQ